MKNRIKITLFTIVLSVLLSGCAGLHKRDISLFEAGNTKCYDRNTQPYTAVVDSHIHFRPFNGKPVPFSELTDYFDKTDVYFANVYGIGQTLPADSSCAYYLDCPYTPVVPSIRNDFANFANYMDGIPEKVHLILSMTSPDLDSPGKMVKLIKLYDREYPGIFRWVGEVNLVKQAIFANGHDPVSMSNIPKWEKFMAVLKERNIPLNIHADLGCDCKIEGGCAPEVKCKPGNPLEPVKYLKLIESVLKHYPDNKIVWSHMGLSKELAKIEPRRHIGIMKRLLKRYPHFMVDLSWRVLWDSYFSDPLIRQQYVDFINEFSTRILPGTDFVASRNKDFNTYREELEVCSRIFKYLNDTAFRNIALGENYFRLLNLNYRAPEICGR